MLRLSVRPGDRLEDAAGFDVHVAGTEANVAFAAARVGLRSAWVSALPGIPLGLSASCFDVGVRAMEAARRRGATVTFDVNYRQRLWPPEAAAEAVRSVAPLIDVLVCTLEDARDLFGAGGGPEAAAADLRA